jgi:hypothetical protein
VISRTFLKKLLQTSKNLSFFSLFYQFGNLSWCHSGWIQPYKLKKASELLNQLCLLPIATKIRVIFSYFKWNSQGFLKYKVISSTRNVL